MDQKWSHARTACVAILMVATVAGSNARGDDHTVGKPKHLRLNPFRPRGPEPAPPMTMVEVGNRIDIIAEGLRDDGSVVIKQPDVYSNAKNTKYRKDFEQQLSTELANFRLIISARNSRLDAATTTSSTSLGAALSGSGKAGSGSSTVAVPTPTAPTFAPNPTPTMLPATAAQSNVTLTEPASAGIGLEPTVYLDEKKRFIDHLNELRRVNMGVDRDESAGYSVYLVRMPISIIPGAKTREGYGAELSIAARHEFAPDFRRNAFRNFVINDLADQLGYVVFDCIRTGRYDPEAQAERAELLADAQGKVDQAKAKLADAKQAVDRAQASITSQGVELMAGREKIYAEIVASFPKLQAKAAELASVDKPLNETDFYRLFLMGQDLQTPGRARWEQVLDRYQAIIDAQEHEYPTNMPEPIVVAIKDMRDDLAQLKAEFAKNGFIPEGMLSRSADFFASTLRLIANKVQVPGGENIFTRGIKAQVTLLQTKRSLQEAQADARRSSGLLSEAQKKAEEALNSINSLNLSSSRLAKRSYPISPREMSDVFLEENLFALAKAANAHSAVTTTRQSDVRSFLRQELSLAYDTLVRPAVGPGGPNPPPLPLFETEAIDEILGAVDHRDFIQLRAIHEKVIDHLSLDRQNVRGRLLGALCWAIAVDAALLDNQFHQDMPAAFTARERPCPDLVDLRFYRPDPRADEVFSEFVGLRWPIVAFALDPVVDQQNVDDAFTLDRDLQLALAFAFSTGQVNFNQMNSFRRQLKQNSETIALNRTVLSFSHGNDVFGFRFFPRYQNPPNQRTNLAVIASQLISGGPGPDYQTRKSKIEPGQRELTAIVLAPSFMPSMRFETTGNWFPLVHPDNFKITTGRMLEEGRYVTELRDVLSYACNAQKYRPSDVRQLAARIDQLEASLPMQSRLIPLPFENATTGFELFTDGTTALVPELSGFEGIDKIDASRTTDLFVFGKNISIHETKVVAGGILLDSGRNSSGKADDPKAASKPPSEVDILSREVVRLTIPPGAATTLLDDGKPYVEVYLATPNGVSNRLFIPAIPKTGDAASDATAPPTTLPRVEPEPMPLPKSPTPFSTTPPRSSFRPARPRAVPEGLPPLPATTRRANSPSMAGAPR